MVAGLLLMAGARIYSGIAGAQEAKANQAMMKYNAQLSERAAKQKELETEYKAKRQAEVAERRLSSMRAEMGAAGVVPSAGTSLLVQATQAFENERENLMIGYEGQSEATALRSEAAGYRMRGKAYGQKARSSLIAGGIGAGATLLTGFSKAGYLDDIG